VHSSNPLKLTHGASVIRERKKKKAFLAERRIYPHERGKKEAHLGSPKESVKSLKTHRRDTNDQKSRTNKKFLLKANGGGRMHEQGTGKQRGKKKRRRAKKKAGGGASQLIGETKSNFYGGESGTSTRHKGISWGRKF